MALTPVGSQFGKGGTGLSDGTLKTHLEELVEAVEEAAEDIEDLGDPASYATAVALSEVLTEARSLTSVVVDGAAENTDIAVAGLTAEDQITSCVMFDTGVPSILTPSAQTAGNIQFATATTGNKIVVSFLVVPVA